MGFPTKAQVIIAVIAATRPFLLNAQSTVTVRQTPVYISAHAQVQSAAPLARFIADLTKYELMRVSALKPEVAQAPRSCSQRRIQQTSEANVQQVVISDTSAAGIDESHFTVEVTIDIAGNAATLDASVHQCGSGASALLGKETRAVPLVDPLSELLAFAEMVRNLVRGVLPRYKVSFQIERGTDLTLEGFSHNLTDALLFELEQSETLQAADSNAPYQLKASLAKMSRDSVLAVVRLTSAGREISRFEVRGEQDDVSELAEVLVTALTSRVLGHWYETTSIAAVSKDPASLVAKAREALCVDGPSACQPNIDAAAAALDLAIAADTFDVETRILVGVLEAARVNRVRAIEWLEGTRTLRTYLGAGHRARVQLHAMLGSLYRDIGNYAAALASYDSVAVLQPSVAVAIERARLSRALSQPIEALRILAAYSTDSVAVRNAREIVVDLKSADVKEHGQEILRACRAIPFIQEVCGAAIVAAARTAEILRENRKQLILGGIELRPNDPNHVTYALGAIAADYQGVLIHPVNPNGRMSTRFVGNEPDTVAKYLDAAESEAGKGSGANRTTKSFVGRIRVHYLAASGRYSEAVAHAQSVRAALSSADTRYAVAQAHFIRALDAQHSGQRDTVLLHSRVAAAEAFALIRSGHHDAHLYFREANHLLGLDRETRQVLDSLARGNSRSRSVLNSLAYLCGEHFHDYGCAFEAASNLMKLTGATFNDSLQVIEYAVLASRFDVAESVYQTVQARGLNPCLDLVRSFYGVWTSLGRGARLQAQDRFSSWEAALAQARNGRQPGCWVFSGARAQLRNSPFVDRRFVLQMLDAMERRADRVPVFPARVATD